MRGGPIVGRTMRDLMATEPVPDRMQLWRLLAGASTGGKPVVRSVNVERTTPMQGELGRPVSLRVRATACLSAQGMCVSSLLCLALCSVRTYV